MKPVPLWLGKGGQATTISIVGLFTTLIARMMNSRRRGDTINAPILATTDGDNHGDESEADVKKGGNNRKPAAEK